MRMQKLKIYYCNFLQRGKVELETVVKVLSNNTNDQNISAS